MTGVATLNLTCQYLITCRKWTQTVLGKQTTIVISYFYLATFTLSGFPRQVFSWDSFISLWHFAQKLTRLSWNRRLVLQCILEKCPWRFFVLHTSKINYLHRQLHCLEKNNPWSIFTRKLTNYYRFSINVHVTRCQTIFSSRPKDTKRKVHRANTAHSNVGTEGTPVLWIYWFICDI